MTTALAAEVSIRNLPPSFSDGRGISLGLFVAPASSEPCVAQPLRPSASGACALKRRRKGWGFYFGLPRCSQMQTPACPSFAQAFASRLTPGDPCSSGRPRRFVVGDDLRLFSLLAGTPETTQRCHSEPVAARLSRARNSRGKRSRAPPSSSTGEESLLALFVAPASSRHFPRSSGRAVRGSPLLVVSAANP